MTFASASDSWNRDREESQQAGLKQTSTAGARSGVRLEDWLNSRAQHFTPLTPAPERPPKDTTSGAHQSATQPAYEAYAATQTPESRSLENWLYSREQTCVTALGKEPQPITRNQQQRAVWKEAEEDTVDKTRDSRSFKGWLQSRGKQAAVPRSSAINLTAAFSRPTFVPTPSAVPFTPQATQTSAQSNESTPQSHQAEQVTLKETPKPTDSKPNPIRVTSGQVFLALSRLVLEVNWDYFHANRLNLNISKISPLQSQQQWKDICKVYDEYIKAAAEGVNALMKLYQEMKSVEHILDIEQTVLNPLMRVFLGYEFGTEGEMRGRKALEALLLEGDFLVYVTEWCRQNGLEYPGGTGRTKERLKEYASGSSPQNG